MTMAVDWEVKNQTKQNVKNKQKYVQEVLVNGLAKIAQKKVWLGELT